MAKFPDDLGLLSIHLYVIVERDEPRPVKDTVERLLASTRTARTPPLGGALRVRARSTWTAPRRCPLAALEVGPRDPDLLYDLACLSSLAGDVPAG
jgi:hypothetical protein